MSAVISGCGKYRYLLKRKIPTESQHAKKCLFIMLNPSTADASTDDPTIRRCITFASRLGCSELTVVNLFALRATNPRELLKALKDDPVQAFGGFPNVVAIESEIESHSPIHDVIICAWGKQKGIKAHGDRVASLVRESGRVPYCLGTTKDGHPRHPLFVRSDRVLEEYRTTTQEETSAVSV